YSCVKRLLSNALVVSFDSCGHGESQVPSETMRLSTVLEEIDTIVKFLKQFAPSKPIILVAISYGGYRVMQYLIKYKPDIKKVVYINPAFRMLQIMEKAKGFRYADLKQDEKVIMKRSLNKFVGKPFLDDLYENDLYSKVYDIDYDTHIVVGSKDSLIPVEDTLEIAKRYNYPISYVEDEHCFENKDNWQVIADIIEGV
ncbi:MAG: alpha/beta fold hydrolase, partial [Clostridia bacterium]|nr:alpha/beta fold hydrolase [Clostridia bacterium]